MIHRIRLEGELRRPDWKTMRLRDLFSDDAVIEPQAAAVDVRGTCGRQPRGEAGRSVLCARRQQDRRCRASSMPRLPPAPLRSPATTRRRAIVAIPFVVTPNPRRALALAAARFYPRQPATIAAVTGTSGKTSVAAFTRQIWERLGHASASIGTIGLVSPKRTVYGSLTTPDPIALHRQLDEIAGDGVTHLAFEASSHGLDQFRLDGVRIAAGGFTNLSRDHMDYHPTVAHYLDAKLRLFRDLVLPGGAAVISADHDCSQEVIEAARSKNLADHRGRPQRGRRRRGHSAVCRRRRWLCATARARTSRPQIHDQAAAGRRIPDRECAGRRRARDRHRQRAGGGACDAGTSRRRQGAARAGRRATTARRSSSITRTSRMRWRRRCRRCGPTPSASWSWCSAPAAIATPASARSWARSRT